jgi:hypothetical protein
MGLISTVTPAKAGVSEPEVSAGLHQIPAFAGMTRRAEMTREGK